MALRLAGALAMCALGSCISTVSLYLCDAFQSHPCVNVLIRQRLQGAVRASVRLHEDQVVELDETRVIFQAGASRSQLRLEVIVQL